MMDMSLRVISTYIMFYPFIYIRLKNRISPLYPLLPQPRCSMCIFRTAAIEKDGLQTYCPRDTWGGNPRDHQHPLV